MPAGRPGPARDRGRLRPEARDRRAVAEQRADLCGDRWRQARRARMLSTLSAAAGPRGARLSGQAIVDERQARQEGAARLLGVAAAGAAPAVRADGGAATPSPDPLAVRGREAHRRISGTAIASALVGPRGEGL